jgi:hypothetical protein
LLSLSLHLSPIALHLSPSHPTSLPISNLLPLTHSTHHSFPTTSPSSHSFPSHFAPQRHSPSPARPPLPSHQPTGGVAMHTPPPRSLAKPAPMASVVRTPSPLSAAASTIPTHLPTLPAYHAPTPSPKPSLGYRAYPAYHPQGIDVSVIVSQAADTAATSSASGFRRAHSRPASVSMARGASLDAEKGVAGPSPRPSYDTRRSHDLRELNMRASHDVRRSYDLRPSADFGATRPSTDFGRPSNDFAAFPPSWAHAVHDEPPRSRIPLRQLAIRAARDRLGCGNRSGALGRGLMIGWVLTTLGFVAATAFWKGELFAGELGGLGRCGVVSGVSQSLAATHGTLLAGIQKRHLCVTC